MNLVPPTFYKWAQFDEICSCGNRIAVLQRDFEKQEKELLEQGNSVQDARIAIIRRIGYKRICCLRDLTYFPKNLICDTCTNASVDITINKEKNVKENLRSGNNSGQVGWEFNPKTRGVLGFDPNSYCIKLALLTRSNYNKVAVLRRDGSSSIKEPAQFPGYRVVKKEDFPCTKPEFPIISVENLTLDYLNNDE